MKALRKLKPDQAKLILKDKGIESLIACSKDEQMAEHVKAYTNLLKDLKASLAQDKEKT